MNALRPLLSFALLVAAFAAQANLINFDDATGTVGSRYLASDGLSFSPGQSFRYPGTPSGPNAFTADTATLLIGSVNGLGGNVSFRYASVSIQNGGAPTFSAYASADGTGVPLATIPLADTASTTTFALATLAIPGATSARSLVLGNSRFSSLVLDDLAFSPVPEPSTLAALSLGALALLRRKGKR